jgi:hypothetical protein
MKMQASLPVLIPLDPPYQDGYPGPRRLKLGLGKTVIEHSMFLYEGASRLSDGDEMTKSSLRNKGLFGTMFRCCHATRLSSSI